VAPAHPAEGAAPEGLETIIDDLILGHRSVANEQMDDMVLYAGADGTPHLHAGGRRRRTTTWEVTHANPPGGRPTSPSLPPTP
jgi:hypothetical protein